MLDFLNTEPIFTALGWAVLHSLWQGALIAVIIAVLRHFTPDRLADIRHCAGIIGLTAMLASFIGTFVFYANTMTGLGMMTMAEAGRQIITLGNNPAPGTALTVLTSNTMIIGIAWAACFIIMAIRYFSAWQKTHLLRKCGLSALPGTWAIKFNALARKAGVSARTKAYISEHVSGPMTFGFLKPIVLVPTWFFTGMSSQQCEMILLHELAHIRRHDYLTNILSIIAKTVFFYHPAVNYICKVTDIEREHACDDFATKINGHAEELAVALGTIRLKSARRADAFALSADKPDAPLMHRLKRLVGAQGRTIGIRHHRAATAMIALCIVISASLGFSKSEAHPHDAAKPAWLPELAGKPMQVARERSMHDAMQQREKANTQRENYEDMRDELLPELKSDGFIKSKKSEVEIKITSNYISINNQKLNARMENKYCDIVSDYMGHKGDVNTIIMKPDFLHIEQTNRTGSHSYTYNK